MSILDEFDVLEVPQRFSIAELRVMKNNLSFNLYTASELGYPPYVRTYISKDRTVLAIKGVQTAAKGVLPFFEADTSSKKRRAIRTGCRNVCMLFKKNLGWSLDEPMIVSASRFGSENVLVFDMKEAYRKGEKNQIRIRPQIIKKVDQPFYPLPPDFFSGRRTVLMLEDSCTSKFIPSSHDFNGYVIDVPNES